MSKLKKEILAEDKIFHVEMIRRHPNGRMKLGETTITIPGNYELKAGTDLGTAEVASWFKISPAKSGAEVVKPVEKKAKPAKASEVKA